MVVAPLRHRRDRQRRWTKHRSWPHASDGLLRTLKPKWCRQSRILRLLPSVTRARFCCGDSDGFDSARASANSFFFRSSLFRCCRHTYGMARQQLNPKVHQAAAPAAKSAATDLPLSRWRSVTTCASCRQTMQTSQCFASLSHLFNWSGSRGLLPTLRVATKRFICCAVCCEWSVSVPFRVDERAGSTRTGAGRARAAPVCFSQYKGSSTCIAIATIAISPSQELDELY